MPSPDPDFPAIRSGFIFCPLAVVRSFVFNALHTLSPRYQGAWVSPSPIEDQNDTKITSADFTSERCQHRTPTVRPCRSVVVDLNSSFCAAHSASEPADSPDFADALTEKPAACRTPGASTIPSARSTRSWLRDVFRLAAPVPSPTSAASYSPG
jgi:hypothetical protein